MWIVTSIGFFSLTNHRDQPSNMMVRGRVRSDMERMMAMLPKDKVSSEIIETEDTDYRYRIIADRDAVGAVVGNLAAKMDYIGFKDHMAQISGETREEIYYSVWAGLSILSDVETDILREEAYN